MTKPPPSHPWKKRRDAEIAAKVASAKRRGRKAIERARGRLSDREVDALVTIVHKRDKGGNPPSE